MAWSLRGFTGIPRSFTVAIVAVVAPGVSWICGYIMSISAGPSPLKV